MVKLQEAKAEDMEYAIITLGKPLITLLKNMDNGQCNNAIAKASVDNAIESLRVAIRALRSER